MRSAAAHAATASPEQSPAERMEAELADKLADIGSSLTDDLLAEAAADHTAQDRR